MTVFNKIYIIKLTKCILANKKRNRLSSFSFYVLIISKLCLNSGFSIMKLNNHSLSSSIS